MDKNKKPAAAGWNNVDDAKDNFRDIARESKKQVGLESREARKFVRQDEKAYRKFVDQRVGDVRADVRDLNPPHADQVLKQAKERARFAKEEIHTQSRAAIDQINERSDRFREGIETAEDELKGASARRINRSAGRVAVHADKTIDRIDDDVLDATINMADDVLDM